jgi:hypothetical protein
MFKHILWLSDSTLSKGKKVISASQESRISLYHWKNG